MSKRPKLIATDLDGTIVSHKGVISQRTIDVFTRARDLGVHVFFVTGRPPRWMGEIREAFGFGEAICCNGLGFDSGSEMKCRGRLFFDTLSFI